MSAIKKATQSSQLLIMMIGKKVAYSCREKLTSSIGVELGTVTEQSVDCVPEEEARRQLKQALLLLLCLLCTIAEELVISTRLQLAKLLSL